MQSLLGPWGWLAAGLHANLSCTLRVASASHVRPNMVGVYNPSCAQVGKTATSAWWPLNTGLSRCRVLSVFCALAGAARGVHTSAHSQPQSSGGPVLLELQRGSFIKLQLLTSFPATAAYLAIGNSRGTRLGAISAPTTAAIWRGERSPARAAFAFSFALVRIVEYQTAL